MGPLNLSDANLKGFDALEPGRYNAEVFEITMDATKGGEGAKMPKGTPLMKVQLRLVSDAEGNTEGIENRRVFTQYTLPPADYDKQKAATMKGMVARFFIATGDKEEDVLSKKFDPDFEDYKGRPVVVTLSKKRKYGTSEDDNEWENEVKGIKPAGSAVAAGGLL